MANQILNPHKAGLRFTGIFTIVNFLIFFILLIEGSTLRHGEDPLVLYTVLLFYLINSIPFLIGMYLGKLHMLSWSKMPLTLEALIYIIVSAVFCYLLVFLLCSLLSSFFTLLQKIKKNPR